MKPEWGHRRTCGDCSSNFYDMNRSPITCPKCNKVYKEKQLSKKESITLNNAIEDSEEDLVRAKMADQIPVDEMVSGLPLHSIKTGDQENISAQKEYAKKIIKLKTKAHGALLSETPTEAKAIKGKGKKVTSIIKTKAPKQSTPKTKKKAS